jgi:hypothetical protein
MRPKLILVTAAVSVALGGCAQARRIPMTVHATHPYVQVSVNHSEPLWFLLDTGAAAPVNLIDAGRAAAIGLRTIRERSAGAIGGSAKVALTDSATLTIGSLDLGAHPLATMDFVGHEGQEGHAIHGILGYAFFKDRVVTIDYPRGILLIGGRGHGGSVVPMAIVDKAPVIRASLAMRDSTQEVRLIVDTGFDDTIVLTRPFVERHALLGLADSSGTSGTGLGGEITSRITRARRLRIGAVEFDDVRVRLAMDREGAFASDAVDGYIGSALLQRCAVTFDYRGGRMILERR